MSANSFNVRIAANGRIIAAIDDFSFAHNTITFLFGESGIGKSMLCKAVYGLLDPAELSVTVNNMPYQTYLDGEETRKIRQSSFFVFQEPSSHLNPLMRIADQLREGSIDAKESEDEVFSRLWDAPDREKLVDILTVYPKPYRPSGGEKQRILLAMAFKKIKRLADGDGPTFFVFDEPTGSLDNNYRNRFLDYLFREFAHRPFTAMVITHDYSIISELYQRHSGLLDRIHFKELERCGEGKVAMRDFRADDYLTWLKSGMARGTAAAAGEPVVRVSPRFRIFGTDHRICCDPARREEAELIIRPHEMVYVKAPSGAGKTTLAKIIMGLYKPEKFSMVLAGMTINETTPRSFFETRVWGRVAGMVFQHADEALDGEATVADTMTGLPLGRTLTREDLLQQLEEVFEGGVTEAFLGRKVKGLSGGQKQRLNLLRTMVLHPALIILDEPLNGLDFDSMRKIIALLGALQKNGAALLVISHNEEIFDALIDPQCIFYLA